ncbi:MAG: hypothetical protein ACREIA_19875 [Opitutaceae bacterium]
MRYRISPLRCAFEGVLGLFGLGPRRSLFTAARDPESRLRFAQYMNRVQPPSEHSHSSQRAIRFLGSGGAVSRGIIRHAPFDSNAMAVPTPAFRACNQPGTIAARRRASAQQIPNPLRLLLHALRVR